MENLFLLFSHQLTESQKKDAKKNLGINNFHYLPEELQQRWSNIPANIEKIAELLEPFQKWLNENSVKNDYVLIQGDFGAVFIMVQWAVANDLIPIYSTTIRDTKEKNSGDEIKIKKKFKHVLFREYEII
ncbi:MAG: CRISPR-associated protein Csx20 [Bacillota bacterium]